MFANYITNQAILIQTAILCIYSGENLQHYIRTKPINAAGMICIVKELIPRSTIPACKHITQTQYVSNYVLDNNNYIEHYRWGNRVTPSHGSPLQCRSRPQRR